MNPAWSVVFFTVLAGCGQGLAVALALAVLAGAIAPATPFLLWGLALAMLLLVGGLASSFLHLGHPLRGWRAAAMWRTSWLSREVIVLPAFIGVLAAWWLAVWRGAPVPALDWALPLAAIGGAALLWLCTAMIYACIRFIQEWAHPLTVANYVLIGLSSGLVLAAALAFARGEARLASALGAPALLVTLVAGIVRMASFRRNAGLKPRSTLQSATGIRARRLVQMTMGLSGGSFNTREFFHGLAEAAVRRVRLAALALGFGLPLALGAWALLTGTGTAWLAAVLVQAVGLLAERWVFFAQARHPQNLYYQRVG
ncbi:dimethyl sulfoxide reductase anchor subunit family protein [Ramlibacter sp. AN1133]|uniref:dimethyl sulfoxide reductase anchor subunit family protein n=1 Tax=Ramlibacter sp. AN1133 TaxID=3133429 RepID=UPI0030BCE3F5